MVGRPSPAAARSALHAAVSSCNDDNDDNDDSDTFFLVIYVVVQYTYLEFADQVAALWGGGTVTCSGGGGSTTRRGVLVWARHNFLSLVLSPRKSGTE